ncbi:MAG: type IV pilus twitching motility protein PilT [Pseudobutyrivibrio sp.]|mgnify:CR=1 FL=1|nr:type IV pilus twitching motility protein PilT [Pseudobutyrivibrio sp.]
MEEQKDPRLEKFISILQKTKENGGSDIHLAPRSPIMIRLDGVLVPLEGMSIEPFEIEGMLEVMLTPEQNKVLDEMGELDYAFSIGGFNRMRINVFRQRGTYAMAIRLLSFDIPDPAKLGIPQAVIDMSDLKRGLILVTGATGSGKSTTLAALISMIAQKYQKHIITLEDPIEYLHKHGKSMVLQREVGFDTHSYANALRAALRQDPDVILVGEMRDLETISTAITAAETGHLVLSTLHTNSTSASIDRMVDVFPPHQQNQIRIQLATVLEGIIAQQLLPMEATGGRVAAFEVMLCNPAIRNLIREGKSFQIPSVLQTSKKEGMQTMDDAIYELYIQGKVSSETAVSFALDQTAMQRRVF